MHSTADLSAQPGSVSSMTTTQTNLRRSSLPEDSQMTTTTVVKSRKRVKSEFQKLFHTLQKYPADVVLQYQMKEFIYDHMELLNENMILSVLNLCETIPENIVEGTKSYQSQISIDDVMDIQLVCLELQAITEPWTDEKAMEYFTILKKFNPMQCPHHVCILAVLINRIRATLLHQLPDSDLPLPNTTITVVGSVNPPDPSFYWFTTNTFVEFFLRIRLFPYDIQLQTLLELMAEKMKETLTIRPIPHLYNAIHDEHTGIKTNVYIYQLSIIQPLTIPQYAKVSSYRNRIPTYCLMILLVYFRYCIVSVVMRILQKKSV